MKKTLLLFILLTSFSAFAQKIPKGTKFIGGDFSFSFLQSKIENASKFNTISFGIAPLITKFKKDNYSVSYTIAYNYTHTKNIPFQTQTRFPNNNNQHQFLMGMYSKNYKMLTEKLGLAVQYGGSIGFIFGNYREKSSFIPRSAQRVSSEQGIAINIGASPSIIYLLNKKIAIEGTATLLNLNLNYIHNALANAHSFAVSTGLNGSPALGFGIRYFYKKP
jgi:hypothetical protein